MDEGKEWTGLEAEVQGSKGKERGDEVVLQPPLEKGDSVECSLVSAEGGPIEWHSGTVISVNAKLKSLTVRATVDGDIQVETYKFSVSTKLSSPNFYGLYYCFWTLLRNHSETGKMHLIK